MDSVFSIWKGKTPNGFQKLLLYNVSHDKQNPFSLIGLYIIN